VTTDELERVFALATDTQPGRARALCRTIGGGDGPFDDLPVSTCLSFVAGHDRPTSVTAHFPVRAYVRDDIEARDRIENLLGECGIDAGRYREAVDAVAHRALDAGVGLHSYASLKASATPTCTIYVGSEACRLPRPRGCACGRRSTTRDAGDTSASNTTNRRGSSLRSRPPGSTSTRARAMGSASRPTPRTATTNATR
jgi:hypothetical protein